MDKYGKQKDSSYSLRLRRIGLILKEEYKGAKLHHIMECAHCGHEWSATPVSKIQTHKKYGVNGCPNCKQDRFEEMKRHQLIKDLELLRERSIEVVDQIGPGQLHITTHKIKFKNVKCGHTFETQPGNVLHRNINCPTCGKEERTKNINDWSKQNSEKWKETAPEWKVYQSKVWSLTRKTYNKHKDKINPNDLPRGKAGQKGAYHLDHIVPIRYCFEHSIPEEICAHPDNLQMLGWRENVGSRDKLKEGVSVPPLLTKYVISVS
jgi:transcription elongation factor Elf1